MSTLHTVNKSPFTNGALLSCLKHVRSGDAVLLIEDGVFGVIAGTDVSESVKGAMANASVYVLEGDVSARGINAGKIVTGTKAINYDGFVDLVAEHDRTQSWL